MWERLTLRERNVALLVAQGMSNKEIARQLKVSPGTVKLHVHNVFIKLNIKNRYVLICNRELSARLQNGADQMVR